MAGHNYESYRTQAIVETLIFCSYQIVAMIVFIKNQNKYLGLNFELKYIQENFKANCGRPLTLVFSLWNASYFGCCYSSISYTIFLGTLYRKHILNT